MFQGQYMSYNVLKSPRCEYWINDLDMVRFNFFKYAQWVYLIQDPQTFFSMSILTRNFSLTRYHTVQSHVDQTWTEMGTPHPPWAHIGVSGVPPGYGRCTTGGADDAPKMATSQTKKNAGGNTLLASMHTWMRACIIHPVAIWVYPCAAPILY